MLRWASPVMYFRRTATADTELRGQTIKAGDKVAIWYISANRDEEVFDDPHTFDITPHAQRARRASAAAARTSASAPTWRRLEIRVMFEELLDRLPDIELAGDGPAPALQLHQRHQAHAGDVLRNPLGP